MRTELQVIEQLKATVVSHLSEFYQLDSNSSLLETITSSNVEIGFPDIDNMTRNFMIYLLPDSGALEALTMESDQETMNCTAFLLCKGSKNETLIKKVFGYFTAFYATIEKYNTLSSKVDYSQITDYDFYPSVTAQGTCTCIQCSLQMQWQK